MGVSLSLQVKTERWPLASAFAISRGAKTEAVVVVVTISDGKYAGHGECVPYARYSETPELVTAAIEKTRDAFARGLTRKELQKLMPAGAARNAIDCALWDLEAKQSGKTVYELAGIAALKPPITAFTISLGTPEEMAAGARAAADWPLLKIKLGKPGDVERLAAIRAAAPFSQLIVDANEGWTPENLAENFAACAKAKVALIEQPLPAANDTALSTIEHPVPVCADESLHDRATLPGLIGKYDAVNIKLDKAGGLTEALYLAEEATAKGLAIMAGCMVSTSLAVAPALLFAQRAQIVDLDGPLWLAKDRAHGLRYEEHRVYPAEPVLWG